MKTVFMLILCLIILQAKNDRPALEDLMRTFRCANRKLATMLGELTHFKIEEKRIIDYHDFQVTFNSPGQHQSLRISDQAIVQDEYFGDNSFYFALELPNHAFLLTLSNPEQNFLRMQINHSEEFERQVEELVIQLDQKVYYTKYTFRDEKGNIQIINSLTLVSNSNHIKKQIFEEKDHIVESFTGIQYQDFVIQLIFTHQQQNFFNGSDNQVDELANIMYKIAIQSNFFFYSSNQLELTCNELVCEFPSKHAFLKLFHEHPLPAEKIECNQQSCWIEEHQLFSELPFITTRYQLINYELHHGILVEVLDLQESDYVQINSVIAKEIGSTVVKDFDFHHNQLSASIIETRINKFLKLCSYMIIDPSYEGINRSYSTKSPLSKE